MTKLSNSMNQIFTSDELRILGLNPGDGNIVKTLNISTAERLVDSAGLDEEQQLILKVSFYKFRLLNVIIIIFKLNFVLTKFNLILYLILGKNIEINYQVY